MNSTEYIQLALRTEAKQYPFEGINGVSPRVEHGVDGLVTEAAEMMDAMKKAKFYGKQLDRVNLMEEMGDCLWYMAILCDELGVTFEELWERNIAKLRVRYPDGFREIRSSERDLAAERKVLGG